MRTHFRRPPGPERAACFTVPAWHQTLWGEHASGSPEAQRVGTEGDARIAGFASGFMPEVFHRLYAETPAPIAAGSRHGAAAARGRLHDLASELPEFETLRRSTVHAPAWAGLGATVIAESVASAIPEPPAAPADADRARRILDGMRALHASGAADDATLAASEGTAAGTVFAVKEYAADLDESAIRRALRTAIERAHAAIDDAQSTITAFGYGESLETGSAADMSTALDLARTVRSSAKLARIVELAGRLTATARAKRATRTQYARSETVGVEPTGDVSRLLPCELAHLADPFRGADLVRRLAERAALGYKIRGREKLAKGPIIALLDASYSMRDGGKEEWSKAIALALLDAARTDKRPFGLMTFNAGIVADYIATKAADVDPRAILNVLASSCSGGTAFAPPVDKAIGWIEGARETRGALRRADVVLITDGFADREGAARRREFLKELGATVYAIAIGTPGGGLVAWADETTTIDDVSRDTAAVDLIFDRI